MWAQFEEKEYEGPANIQLLSGNTYISTPGQVLEKFIGFDAAMFTQNAAFWGICRRQVPPGCVPSPSWWTMLPQDKHGRIPTVKCNLFVQYKRPYQVTSPNGKCWSDWGGKYYRYPIELHQQAALHGLAKGVGQAGLVIYACPAFHSYYDLQVHTKNASLIGASNFVEAADLSGHGMYTFTSAGTDGLACSERRKTRSIDIEASIKDLCAVSQERVSLSEEESLVELSEIVDGIFEKELRYAANYYRARFQEVSEVVAKQFSDYSNLTLPWLKIAIGASLIGLTWYTGTED